MNNDIQIRVGDLMYAVMKRWKMMLALTVLGCICGFALSGISYIQGTFTSYEISCSVAINTKSESGEFTGNSEYLNANDFYLAQDMVDAASYVMKSDRVLKKAIDEAGLVSVTPKDVLRNLDIDRYNETQVLEITLSWNDEQAGLKLMNAILDAGREALPETLMTGSFSIIDEPQAKYMLGGGGSLALWIIFGMLGFFIGVGASVLDLIMKPTLLNLRDVEEVLGLETLGVIPHDDMLLNNSTDVLEAGEESGSEAARNFASSAYILNNRLGTKDKHHCIYVTSADDGEGKSVIAAGLAVRLSDMEKRTLLIDLNMKNPSLGSMFLDDTDYSRTLNALYKGEATTDDAFVSLSGHLDLLPTVLERNAMPLDGTLFDFIRKMSERYDYVIIDAPSVGRSTDVMKLNQIADAVVFVVRYDTTVMPDIQESVDKLDKSGVRILGCIVNDAHPTGSSKSGSRSASSAKKKHTAAEEEFKPIAGTKEESILPNEAPAVKKQDEPETTEKRSAIDELTDDPFNNYTAMSDDEAVRALLRLGSDVSRSKKAAGGKASAGENQADGGSENVRTYTGSAGLDAAADEEKITKDYTVGTEQNGYDGKQ